MSKMLRMSEEDFAKRNFTKNEKAKLARRGIKAVIRIPTEHEEQAAVIEWADKHPIAKHLFAIPNGSNKSPAMAAKFKREGLRPGVPDLFLPVAVKPFHGAFFEMKRTKGGVLSRHQIYWASLVVQMGYHYMLCEGAEDAINEIRRYLHDL